MVTHTGVQGMELHLGVHITSTFVNAILRSVCCLDISGISEGITHLKHSPAVN